MTRTLAGKTAGILPALAMTILLFGGVAFADKKPEKVVIGFQVIPNAEIVAKGLGWQEKSLGVPVKWVQIDSGRDLNTAMLAGSVDIGLGGSSPVAAGIANGIPYEVIWIHDVIGDNEALTVRKGSNIDSVEGLVGRKVAVPFGSTTHYHLLVALKVFKVDPRKVTILDLQPPDMLAAWQRGDIDAGFVWEPTLDKLKGFDGKVILTSRQLAEKGYLTGDICVVRKAFAGKYPDLVVQYLKNLVRGVALYHSDPGKAAAEVADQFDIPQPEALRQMKSLILLSDKEQLGDKYLGTPSNPGTLASVLKDTADFLAEQKLIKSSPGIDVFKAAINTTYLEKAGQ